MSETPKELKERLLGLRDGFSSSMPKDDIDTYASQTVAVEKAFQLCRIAEALEKIIEKGLYIKPWFSSETKETDLDEPQEET